MRNRKCAVKQFHGLSDTFRSGGRIVFLHHFADFQYTLRQGSGIRRSKNTGLQKIEFLLILLQQPAFDFHDNFMV